MVKKSAWAICAYFMTLSFLFAGKELALKVGADAAFNAVVRVRNSQGVSTATLMHVEGNPFFLTAKHGVLRRKDLWVESEHYRFAIRGVQALIGDMALLFPKHRLPKRLLMTAIDIEAASPIFSIPQGCIHHNGIPHGTKYISLKGFPHIEGYGAGFGAPVLGWRGPIGLLDWKSPSLKNAFMFELEGLGSDFFESGQNHLVYDLNQEHTLYFRGNPEQGLLNRPLSPGFSGSMVFNGNHQPVGIVTRSVSWPISLNLTRPNGELLRYLRRQFGFANFPWIREPVSRYPLLSCIVHQDVLTAVEPLYPSIETIRLTAQLYYDAL